MKIFVAGVLCPYFVIVFGVVFVVFVESVESIESVVFVEFVVVLIADGYKVTVLLMSGSSIICVMLLIYVVLRCVTSSISCILGPIGWGSDGETEIPPPPKSI